ncbi:MAG: Gfo/Idh/MocA family oxidoreductase [Ruminococcus sp.]|nr:Gfo/Idh/MocA family oxidoreductase [Ruminococcus sp.]
MNDETSAWAKGMGVEQVTKDYKEILQDEEIDAEIICSSTNTHSAISVEAIEAGKYVFCEKPIDHDIEKIKQVMEALKKTEVKYHFKR